LLLLAQVNAFGFLLVIGTLLFLLLQGHDVENIGIHTLISALKKSISHFLLCSLNHTCIHIIGSSTSGQHHEPLL
jgi:hypothetical protein